MKQNGCHHFGCACACRSRGLLVQACVYGRMDQRMTKHADSWLSLDLPQLKNFEIPVTSNSTFHIQSKFELSNPDILAIFKLVFANTCKINSAWTEGELFCRSHFNNRSCLSTCTFIPFQVKGIRTM